VVLYLNINSQISGGRENLPDDSNALLPTSPPLLEDVLEC
ncbi:3238_t:CDS:1, partial [Dentiscutata erythropus]